MSSLTSPFNQVDNDSLSVRVSSEPGRGSVFTVSLPLAPQQ